MKRIENGYIKPDIFQPITLDEMQDVKLMNRVDTKYWFHIDKLQHLLESIQHNYYVLSINNALLLPYKTTYYDTVEDRMFVEHHNGKLNRYKIRRRSYVSSKMSFLEVKFKSNKGRTIKERIATEFGNNSFNEREDHFLLSHSPFTAAQLRTSLINNFSRITLVNKNFNERCTIDLHLNFEKGQKSVRLNSLVIVEIKSEGSACLSPLSKALRNNRIKSSGFSKYCVGRTLTDATLKQNAFKPKIRSIQKEIQSTSNSSKNYFSI